MNKNLKETAFAISEITQLGIRIVVSFLIWILISVWIKNTFNLGNYITVLGIICGVGSAALSFYDFSKKIVKMSKKETSDED